MPGRTIVLLSAVLLACARADHSTERQDALDSLLGPGSVQYARGDFDSALAFWTGALVTAEAAGDSAAQAHLLTWLGKAAWRLGDLEWARGAVERAVAIKTARGMEEFISDSWNTLGLIELSYGDNEAAREYFERAIESARAAGDVRGIGRGSGNLALSFSYEGDPRARAAHRALREAGRTLGDGRMEGNGLANEAMVDIWEGNPRTALARLDSARALYRLSDYATGDENSLGQMAAALAMTGEYDRAFAALDTALTIARRHGLLEGEVRDLLQIAELHTTLGDHRRAIRYYDQAADLLAQTGLNAERAMMLRGVAAAHLRLGNLARARGAANEALRLHTMAGELPDQLDDLVLLAELDYRESGRGGATSRLREARRVAERLATRGARVTVALAEAYLADQAGDARGVLAALRGAARDLQPDIGAEWEAQALAARAFARLGRLDSAAEAGRRAVTAVERQRRTLASEALRAVYVADRAGIYGDLVAVLLRLGLIDEAFVVADGARSRELLEQVSTSRGGGSGAAQRDLLDADLLLRKIDDLSRLLGETAPATSSGRGVSDTAGTGIARELAAARHEYEDLLVRAAQRRPRAAAIMGARPPRLDEVRAALAPGEALVEYLIAGEQLLIFAVTRSGVRVARSELDGRSLAHRVRLLRDLWGVPSGAWRDGLPASRALHAVLVAPLLADAQLQGVSRLLIVPHGILSQVPFAALQDGRSGRFLGQDFGLSQLPSAATLPALRLRAGATRPWSGALTALAPFPVELPATALEVRALREEHPRAGVRLGARASERSLRRALGETGVVHVATHGILNAGSPMFSRLELARRGPLPADDGRLEVHEVLGLEIRSPLVFLSGCETGAVAAWTDDPVRGTANLSLAQAVLSAGAANVVVTLWRIDDEGAAVFAARFYQALSDGDVVAALATAQRALASDPRWESPYYWAGYALAGEGAMPGRALRRDAVATLNNATPAVLAAL